MIMDVYKCDNCNHDKYITGPAIDAINSGTLVKCANCGAYMYLTNTGHFVSVAISNKMDEEFKPAKNTYFRLGDKL